MGVVNVTPDSFSDGGEFLEPDAAIQHGLELLAEGADIIDVGGESTRPGAERPTTDVELARVLPVVAALAEAGAVVSIDTMRPVVAEAAIGAGAGLVNDVSGGRSEPALLRLVAEAGLPYVCMHWRGHSADMQSRAVYEDVVAEVTSELRGQLDACIAAGIAPERLIVDPGLGFAKTGEHNWQLLRRLDELDVLGVPLLVGASRKRFLGTLLAAPDGTPRAARDRDAASAALSALLAERGIWGVRVHAVRATLDAVLTADRLSENGRP
ncbi:MAG TPA: dihydropteroate synthase [Microlunatus sp.]|nr:dihydropteroate synthase [Microlunatus sp.]